MKFVLDDKSFEILKEIFSENEKIKKKVIFGSRATGRYNKRSDIDVALFGELNFREISDLKGEYEESCSIYKLDLVHYESLESEDAIYELEKDGIEF